MKKALIAMLVCVNVGLLLTLILGADVPKAQAYSGPGSLLTNNTIMITGQIREDEDAVYVIDMATERLGAWKFEGKSTTRRLRALGVRDLKIDLK